MSRAGTKSELRGNSRVRVGEGTGMEGRQIGEEGGG